MLFAVLKVTTEQAKQAWLGGPPDPDVLHPGQFHERKPPQERNGAGSAERVRLMSPTAVMLTVVMLALADFWTTTTYAQNIGLISNPPAFARAEPMINTWIQTVTSSA